jgi:3-oxoacyl-[acyl-carrier-protein] synthase II
MAHTNLQALSGRRVQNGQPHKTEVVVTGYAVLSPLGIGAQPFWESLCQGRSGIGRISTFDSSGLPVRIAGEIKDFDPKLYVRPRKSLKVMARDTQLGVAVADMACQHAGLAAGQVDPDRVGVVLGADIIGSELADSMNSYNICLVNGKFDFSRWGNYGLGEAYPLVFLKILPNMIASHIAIAQDARGPNNTLHQGDVSSLLAMGEALRAIQRGAADVIIAGGSSSRMQPFDWVRGCLTDDLATSAQVPAEVCRPFDALRAGQVRGEGAAALVLESRPHAESRGARILARLASATSAIETRTGKQPLCGSGLSRAIRRALAEAHLQPGDIDHINAHGVSTRESDQVEAQVLREIFGDTPVTAPKSFFGNLGAASGVVEALVSLLALEHGVVPVTLNYTNPDPACPIHVVSEEPLSRPQRNAVVVNQTTAGQAAAVTLCAL